MLFKMFYKVFLVSFIFGVCLTERIINYQFLLNKRFDNSYKAISTDKLGCMKQCLEDNQEPCISFMYRIHSGRCRLFNRYLTNSENSNGESESEWASYIPYMDTALKKPTHQSSTGGNHPSRVGVDGDVSRTTITDTEENPWWCVDLQRVYFIRLVRIQGTSGSFEVKLSTTGYCDQNGYMSSTPCFQDTGNNGNQESYEVKKCNLVHNTSNITARFIFIGGNGQSPLSLKEVSVLNEFVSHDCD